MSLETFTELIGCGEMHFMPDPTKLGNDGGSFWSITIGEARTILTLLRPNGYEIQLMAKWLSPAGEPVAQMLGRGYPSELEALPVVQQWVDYLRSGGTVEAWKAQYGITRSDGRR
jgi:hypothetical protein